MTLDLRRHARATILSSPQTARWHFLTGAPAVEQLSIPRRPRPSRGVRAGRHARHPVRHDRHGRAFPDVQRFVAALRTQLLAVDRVTGIVTLTTRPVGSTLRYVATLRTVHGIVTVNG